MYGLVTLASLAHLGAVSPWPAWPIGAAGKGLGKGGSMQVDHPTV